MFITRNDNRIEVEQMRSAHLSRGFNVYLFRVLGETSLTDAYIVAVQTSSQETVEYKVIPRTPKCLRTAIDFYMDYLCCYC